MLNRQGRPTEPGGAGAQAPGAQAPATFTGNRALRIE